MAHEVESMMYVGQTPWHGLGTKLEAAPTTREAIQAAGLDWTVAKRPMFYVGNDGITRAETFAVMRTSDNTKLGEVGRRWTPLQNEDAFAWFDPFLQAGEATLETAGSLFDGRRVFILARVKGDTDAIGGDDVVERFILLSNGHDGRMSVRVGFTPIRVVCNNTLALAHGSEASKLVKLRHTGSLADNLDQVREVMSAANAEFEATVEQYRALAKVSIGESELRDYATRVFGESTSRTEAIVELHETGLGADLRGVRGSLWGAYNAVTEYLSWKASRTQDARLSSLWYGPGAALNAQALSTALEDGAGGGVMRQRMWLLMAVDVETHHDAMGNAVDRPLGEPVVLGSTSSVEVAERMAGLLTFDKSGRSMVRSDVEAMPPVVAAVVEGGDEADVERLLSMVDVE